MADSLNYIASTKQKQKFVNQGYIYHFDKLSQNGEKKYWKCEKREDCNARIHTNSHTGAVLQLVGTHSHSAACDKADLQTAIGYMEPNTLLNNDVIKKKKESMHLGHHKAVLMRMCRVCGIHSYDLRPYSTVRYTKTFSADAKVLGVDVSKDDPAIHPSSICKRCMIEATNRLSSGETSMKRSYHYQFIPHKDENCAICIFSCSACLLIPNTVPTAPGGNFRHYEISDEEAVKERHISLLKAIIQLSSKRSPIKCDIDTFSIYSEEHSSPCKLCDAPCPLCGMNLEDAADSYLIRCKSLSNRLLRDRKRKSPLFPEGASDLLREPYADSTFKRIRTESPLRDRNNSPNLKLSDHSTQIHDNMISFKAYDGKTYNIPINRSRTKADTTSTNTNMPTPSPVHPLLSSASEGKSVSKRTVKFGMTPRVVAKTFHDLYKKHCSLTTSIRQVLAMAPFLKYKYKFINPVKPSEQCILIGVLSSRDVDVDVKKELERLDKFVKDSHLSSRAAAIEELLYSPLQNEDSDITDSQGNRADAAHKDTPLINENGLSASESLSQHFLQKTDKTKDCWICNKKFATTYRYNRHCESNYHAAKLTYLKNQAEQANTERDEEARIAEIEKAAGNSPPVKSSNSKGIPTATIYKCHICNATLVDHYTYSNHMWEHQNTQWPTEKISDEKKVYCLSEKYTGVVPHHYKPFSIAGKHGNDARMARCNFCAFTSRDMLTTVCHARKHVGDYPYRCIKCTYRSVSKAMLMDHQKSVGHGGFSIMKRSFSLSHTEIKRLDSMILNKIFIFNTKGTLNIPPASNDNYVNPMIMKIDAEFEEENGNWSNGNDDKNSWNFCRLCNSAFLDKETFDMHVEQCSRKNAARDDDEDQKAIVFHVDGDSSPKEATSNNDEKELFQKVAEYESECDKVLPSEDNLAMFSQEEKNEFQHHHSPEDSSSIENHLTKVTSGFSRRSRKKINPKKRGNLLDVIAGLSSGGSRQQSPQTIELDAFQPVDSNSNSPETSEIGSRVSTCHDDRTKHVADEPAHELDSGLYRTLRGAPMSFQPLSPLNLKLDEENFTSGLLPNDSLEDEFTNSPDALNSGSPENIDVAGENFLPSDIILSGDELKKQSKNSSIAVVSDELKDLKSESFTQSPSHLNFEEEASESTLGMLFNEEIVTEQSADEMEED